MEMINFSKIEKKWQKRWEEEKAFVAKEKKGSKKYSVVEMYPYPSGYGLHMGHAFNYTIGDIPARLKRMQGYNVLYPMGFDSFGLPAENAAIANKSHPKKFTDDAIKNFIRQMKSIGLSYDWTRTLSSHNVEYYKWDQWIFLKMFEKGLAYRKKAPVNFCEKCNTVLANEQVIDGKCWRHTEQNVKVKHLEQWFFKTTAYADELYEGIDKLEHWPEFIKKLQKNWIGKSQGTEVDFEINGEKWKVFTTRADTIFGVTFLVVSAQHPEIMDLVSDKQIKEVQNFLKKIKSVKEEDLDKMEKEGVFTGSYAIHPLSGERIPVYAGNFVVADYGSGIVMGVPAHDERDFAFAKKYGLEIKPVIGSDEKKDRRQDNLSNEFKKFVKEAKKEKKEFILTGGFGLKILRNVSYRNSKDIDILIPEEDFSFWKNYFIKNGYEDYRESENDKRDYSKYALYTKEIDGNDIEFDVWVLCKDEKGYFDMEWGKKRYWNLDDEKITNFNYENTEIKVSRSLVSWKDFDKKINEKKIELDKCFALEGAYTNYGRLVNSQGFDGLTSEEAKEHIVVALSEKGKGRKVTKFRLRDWLVSRQRFWGTPIPIVYCDDCGAVPVSEKDLPVKLPDEIKFSGVENPLVNYEKFTKCKCPKCGGVARRETDTMDTFVNSSWYFLRYCDNENKKKIFDKKKVDYWMPLDLYIGGKEHACLHLIYFRFYTKFLRDLGLLSFDEPAVKLFNQGMLHAQDGRKMSKSFGNIILPESISEKYGMDSARMFLISVASPDKDFNWSEEGIEGSVRFILRVINFVKNFKSVKISELQESKLHRTIRDYTSDLENLKYNLAVIKLRELFDFLERGCDKKTFEIFLKLFSPICPHITEELWERMGNKKLISLEKWPEYDEKKINDELEKQEKQKDKIVEDIRNVVKIVSDRGKIPKSVYLYVIPKEIESYDLEMIKRRTGLDVKIFAVNDSKKYDPENKSGKASLGKPAIYLE